jgi:hypothetical protein
MTKFTRKSKIELQHMTNAESTIAVTITIDSNHTNNDLDTLLSSLTNTTNSLNSYKHKEEVKKQPKQTKKKQFGGNFV